jgi:signal transduction histidine kinase
VDPALALEILVNLIENAHRASPERESIELVADVNPTHPGQVRLEVLDRGGGLAAEALRLGARDAAPSTVSSGDLPRKGLGLEIARSFARAHGGRVELHAREGGGMRASIDLPAAGPAAFPEGT